MESVAICDTEPIAMEGLRRLLESVDGLRVVATESSLPEGLEAVRELKPSMLMVDKSFGIQAVMGLLKDLRDSDLGTHAIVWSTALSDAEALRLIQAGASGVIRKSAPLTMLLTP